MRRAWRTGWLCGTLALVGVGSCASRDTCGVTAPEGCSTLRATAARMAGSWRTVQAPGDISLAMSITARDVLLSGTASVRSPSGSVDADLRGVVGWRASFNSPDGLLPAQPIIRLTLAPTSGGAARFDQGTLRGDTLQGALTFLADSTRSYGLTLVRSSGP